jgi:hypothetical protein
MGYDNEQVYAEYTYEGTTHSDGYEELSDEAPGSCHPGHEVEKSGTYTLRHGNYSVAYYTPNFSDQWDATWWGDGGKSDWGNSCHQY